MGGIFFGWDSSHIPSGWQQFLAPRKEMGKEKGIGFIHFEIAKWLPQGPTAQSAPPPPWPLARHRLAEFPHVKSSELGVF